MGANLNTAERITDALMDGEKVQKYTLVGLLSEQYEPELAQLIANIVSANLDTLLSIQAESRQIAGSIVDAFLASPHGRDLVEELSQVEDERDEYSPDREIV